MTLKDLVMQVTYDEIEPAIDAVFTSFGYEVDADMKESLKKVFATLQSMEPAPDCNMYLRIVPGNVSGYYDEETLKKNPEYWPGFYSLTTTTWGSWLGMEVDDDTLKNMSVAEILGNCIYEMTWWGYDEESIRKNLEDKFGHSDTEEEKEEGSDTKTKIVIDEKTQCSMILSANGKRLIGVCDKSVKNIFIPKGVETIEKGAFFGCDNLQSINLPASIQAEGIEIREDKGWYTLVLGTVFDGCSSLRKITVNKGNKELLSADGILFAKDTWNKWKLIRMPEGCTISHYKIPDKVDEIGGSAFENCANLLQLTLPVYISGSICTWHSYNLQRINALENNISHSSIDGILFSKDKSVLENVPAGKCLKHYEVPEGVREIRIFAFGGNTSIESVTIPNGVKIYPDSFSRCSALQQIIVKEDNTDYATVDGILFNKTKTTLIRMPSGKKTVHYVVPKGIEKIESCAFKDCISLVSLQMPDTVSVVISDAFDGCSSLKYIYVGTQRLKELVEESLEQRCQLVSPPSPCYPEVEVMIKTD